MNLERLRILKDVADRPTNGWKEGDWTTCLAGRVATEFGFSNKKPNFGYGNAHGPIAGFAKFFGVANRQAQILCSAERIEEKRDVLNDILAEAEAEAKARAKIAKAKRAEAAKAKRIATKRAATMAALRKLTEPGAAPVAAASAPETGRRRKRVPARV